MYKPETSYEEFLMKEQEKYPDLNLIDIESLKKLVKANEELPPINNKLLIIFLHGSYFVVEKAYTTIVLHYRYRKELPQVFADFDPSTEEMKKVFDCVSLSLVSQPGPPQKERIIYCSLKTPDPTNYDFVRNSKYFFMMLEYIMVRNGTFDGVTIVINSKSIGWRHVARTQMGALKKLIGFVQEALPIRLKQVHILEVGTVATMVFNITRPFLSSQLMAMLRMHPENSDEVFDKLPIEVMPSEMGGQGKSHFENCEEMYEQMNSDRDWFLSQN